MLYQKVGRLACVALVIGVNACAGNSELITTKPDPKSEAGRSSKSASLPTGVRFTRLQSDPRIIFETGMEAMALSVHKLLDEKAAIIEKRQYAAFSKPIQVYVLASKESAKRYCGILRARGCVVNQRLYISKLAEGTLPKLIQHELSHLHMEQKLGMFRYHSEIPAWFQEGLAVLVSNGAGAEKASFENAIKGFRTDKSITPNNNRSLLFPKKAKQFGIKNSMFYAQSGIFVKYLQRQGSLKFKGLILQLSRGERFSRAISSSYQKTLAQLWSDFKVEITNKDINWLKRYDFK